MKVQLHAICTHEAALGFALSSVPVIEAATGDDAAAALDALGSAEVVLIESALYDALPHGKRRQLRRDGMPIVMPFPSPSIGGIAPEEELLEVLRRAVGYRMRLR